MEISLPFAVNIAIMCSYLTTNIYDYRIFTLVKVDKIRS